MRNFAKIHGKRALLKTVQLVVLLFCFFPPTANAQSGWQKINSVDEVCSAYPEQMKHLFQQLDLNFPGLQEVKKAYQAGNVPLACQKLLDYYALSKLIRKDLPPVSSQTTTLADSVCRDIYTFQNVTGQVPRLPDGHLKWAHNGPEDDIEWAWALNRHYPTGTLLEAYFKTGNPAYARYIDQFTKDWIISSWPYPAVKSSTALWRGLEVSFREKTWARVFFELWHTNLISPATRLLILSSLPDHAHYARNFHAQGNWLTMEISGLATVASSWPEFKESKAWMEYAIQTMVASMKDQVYPDGVQTELTSSYHHVALSNFKLFANICSKNEVKLPAYYTNTLEAMYNYLALSIRPDGFGLLNNDADQVFNRENIRKAAAEYNRPDWLYLADDGQSGTKPANGPSYVFPYAGQLISRSGYNTDAQYSFFDIGPWGTGHQHNDMLHLSVFANGRDLLVDAGRFAYRGEVANKFRKYAAGSAGHNVILIDGNGQAPGITKTEMPLASDRYAITPDYDYGWGSFEKFAGVEGRVSHTRAMLYLRDKCWIVADRIKTDRLHTIDVLWHWHPSNQVQIETAGVTATKNERGNLAIIPVGTNDWVVKLVKGVEKPAIQGWYSREYNTFEPNPTTVYSRQVQADDTFVWILWPSEGKTPAGLKATILSKDNDSVRVLLTEPGQGTWEIRLPFQHSAAAQVVRK